MNVSECENDFDCEGPRLCYVNVSWLLEDGIQSQCGCGTWSAYIGEDCLQLGPGAYYLIISASITGFLALFGLLLSLRVLYLDFPGIRKLTLSSRATTNIYASLGLLGFCGWRAITMYKALTPENINLKITENLNENSKLHSSRIYEIVVIAFTVVFGFVAILNVSLSMIATVDRVATLNTMGERRALRYKLVVLTFEIIIIAVNAVLAPVSSALQIYAVGGIMVCICILYFYGLCRLLPLLESSTKAVFLPSNSKYLDLIKLVKSSSVIMLAGVVIGLIGGAVFGIISLFDGGWKEKTPPGTVSPAIISNEMIPLGGITALLGVEYFVYFTGKYFSSDTTVAKSNSLSITTI